MDGHEHGPLSDRALEHEIAAALAVEPSPEFRARVRARVADDRMRSSWRRPGMLAPLAAATAVAAAAVVAVAMLGGQSTTAGPSRPLVVARTVDVAPGPAPVVESVVEPSASAPTAGRAPRRPPSAARPEVLVSPEDAAALRDLIVALATRQVEAGDIPSLGVEMKPLSPIAEIVLEPIKLSPLDGPESE